MSHDTNNPFSNETGEYLQEVQSTNPVEHEKPVQEDTQPKPARVTKRAAASKQNS